MELLMCWACFLPYSLFTVCRNPAAFLQKFQIRTENFLSKMKGNQSRSLYFGLSTCSEQLSIASGEFVDLGKCKIEVSYSLF